MHEHEIVQEVESGSTVQWQRKRGIWEGTYHCAKAGRSFIGQGRQKETARAAMIREAREFFASIAAQAVPESAPATA